MTGDDDQGMRRSRGRMVWYVPLVCVRRAWQKNEPSMHKDWSSRKLSFFSPLQDGTPYDWLSVKIISYCLQSQHRLQNVWTKFAEIWIWISCIWFMNLLAYSLLHESRKLAFAEQQWMFAFWAIDFFWLAFQISFTFALPFTVQTFIEVFVCWQGIFIRWTLFLFC